MKSNITQAFFRKTGKKTEINSTVIGIIDYKYALTIFKLWGIDSHH